MGLSIIEAQRDIILSTIRQITKGDWKVLVLDPDSRRLIDNVIHQDEILNENVTSTPPLALPAALQPLQGQCASDLLTHRH